MADANETKARIQEIRSRVFQEPLNEDPKKDIADVAFEQDLEAKKPEKLILKKIKPDLIKSVKLAPKEIKPDFMVKDDFIKKDDFINFKNQLHSDIKDYFSALDEKLTKSLNGFETKIPDIKKGSSVREQLDNEIGDIISQRMIQQSRTLNRAIEDLSGSYASANDLSEMKKELEEKFERETNIKLENNLAENKKELDLGLVANFDKLEDLNSSIREDFSSFVREFTSSKSEIDAKLQQNQEKITLMGADVGNRIAKTSLSFANKSSALEETLFNKVEYYFSENTSNLKQLEGILTSSIIGSTKASDDLKQNLEIKLEGSLDKLDDLNNSFREEFSSLLQKVEYGSKKSISNFKELEDRVTDSIISSSKASAAVKNDLEAGLAEGFDKLEEFNNFIRQDFSSFTGGFNSSIDEIDIKLKQHEEKITLVGSDVRNKIAKIILDLSNKNKILEDSISQRLGAGVEENAIRFNDFKGIITHSIISSFKASDALKVDLERGLKDSLEKLEEFNSSIRNDFTSVNDLIDIKIKQNDDKVTLLSSDTMDLIRKTTFDFQKESRALEEMLVQKITDSSEKSASNLRDLEGVVTDSIISSFNASDAAKTGLEVGLKDNLNKLENLNSSVRQDFNTFVSSFTSANDEINTKLKQNEDKITLLSSNTQNIIAKTIHDIEGKNRALGETILQKFEGESEENIKKFIKLEGSITAGFKRSSKEADAVRYDLELGLIESVDKLQDFNSSIRTDFSTLASSFTSFNNEIDTKLKQNDEKISLLSADIRNKITKLTLELKNKSSALGDSSSERTKMVSSKLSIVEAKIKKDLGELRSVVKENLALSNDVKVHVNGLQKNIGLLESMIVREDDLTELFQNYTLNLNIIRDVNDVQFARTHPRETGL